MYCWRVQVGTLCNSQEFHLFPLVKGPITSRGGGFLPIACPIIVVILWIPDYLFGYLSGITIQM